jgi:hypothetical protein
MNAARKAKCLFLRKSPGPEIQAALETTRVTEYGVLNSRFSLKIINRSSANDRPIVWDSGTDNQPMFIMHLRLQGAADVCNISDAEIRIEVLSAHYCRFAGRLCHIQMPWGVKYPLFSSVYIGPVLH